MNEVILRLIEIIVPTVIVGITAWVSVRVEAGRVGVRLDMMEKSLTAMGNVLEAFAKVDGRINRLEDRLSMQGGRTDENTRLLNELSRLLQNALMEMASGKRPYKGSAPNQSGLS